MSTVGTQQQTKLATLEARLAEAEATLRAIYNGEVDALVVAGPNGDQIFTLKGAETPYRLLVEAMNEGAMTLLPEGTILYCNGRFAQMVQKPLEQVTGAKWQQFFSPKEHGAFQKLLAKAKHSGRRGEFTLDTGSRPGVPVEVSIRALKLDEMRGFTVLVTDITARKLAEQAVYRGQEALERRVQERTVELTSINELLRAEIAERTKIELELKAVQEQLQQQAHELERQVAERTAHLQATNQALETVCYNMAHDLRAPNRSMQGFAELLLADHAHLLNPTGQEYLRRISAAAARNDALILDMLAYGQLGHTPLPCGPQSLKAAVQAVLQNLAEEIADKKAKVRVKHPLPHVKANPAALEQALANLVTNALKFVPRGVAPEVSICAEPKGRSVRIRVQDNGIGIPSEHHDRVFKVFERLPAARAFPGTGIGLAIVQKAVERMGGRVGVASQPGKGSCFWFELPGA